MAEGEINPEKRSSEGACNGINGNVGRGGPKEEALGFLEVLPNQFDKDGKPVKPGVSAAVQFRP